VVVPVVAFLLVVAVAALTPAPTCAAGEPEPERRPRRRGTRRPDVRVPVKPG
jgi:hypothetical protein